MARIYTTCMIVMTLLTVFGLACTAAADGTDKFLTNVVEGMGADVGGSLGIHKHIFNFNIGLAGGWFALGVVLIGKMKAQGNKYFTPINLNVIGVVVAALVLVASAVFGLGGSESVQSEGAGMLFGAAFAIVTGGGTSITMALARRDDDPDDD